VLDSDTRLGYRRPIATGFEGELPAPPARWIVPTGIAFAALAGILSVLVGPLLLLALVPLALGLWLVAQRWVASGMAMAAMAVIVPIAVHALLVGFVVRAYGVPSDAMQPTLGVGDRVLVDRTGLDAVGVGKIVVFHPPSGAEAGIQCGVRHPPGQACPRPTRTESGQTFLKRIVAGPGDTLSIRNGHPVVDGVEKTDEPYITACGGVGGCNMPKPITVPPGCYFTLGDNRGASDDSRFWGPVPANWIVGVVIARYSPLSRISFF